MIDGLVNIIAFLAIGLIFYLMYNFLPMWLFLSIMTLIVISECRTKINNKKIKNELEETRMNKWKETMEEYGVPADDKDIIENFNSATPYFDKDKGIEIWPAWYPDENTNPIRYK